MPQMDTQGLGIPEYAMVSVRMRLNTSALRNGRERDSHRRNMAPVGGRWWHRIGKTQSLCLSLCVLLASCGGGRQGASNGTCLSRAECQDLARAEFGQRILLPSGFTFVKGELSGAGAVSNHELSMIFRGSTGNHEVTLVVSPPLASESTYRSKCPSSERVTTPNGRFACYTPFSARVYAFYDSGKMIYGIIDAPPLTSNHPTDDSSPDPDLLLVEAVISHLS
jgi:hypothetical protein